MEDVQSFRLRVREFLAKNLPPAPERERGVRSDEEELAEVTKQREIQRTLFDNGFAGICYPQEYGGQGLTVEHQRALNEEAADYHMPDMLQIPSIGICGPTLLDSASEDQKKRYLPPLLRGDELWMQFLSEPSAGSDLASCITTAIPDGDHWILNGSKVWTSGAWWSDYALCLARTDWDGPKHHGLTVFIVKIHQPGIDVQRIEMINGSREFCQEFLSDVRIPDSDRVGPVSQGWSVASGWMYREREAVGGGSPYVTRTIRSMGHKDRSAELVDLARDTGQLEQPRVRQMLGEAIAQGRVQTALGKRLTSALAAGKIHNSAAGLLRLFGGEGSRRLATIGLEIAGPRAVAWRGADAEQEMDDYGVGYLMRQAACIGGGTTEMARNVIADRLLGMPREITPDRGRPFRDVPKNA